MKSEIWFFKGESDVSVHVEIADTFLTRLRGLMGRRCIPAGYGLFLCPCSSIHMCFMQFAIDAVYFDSSMTIVKIVPRLRPWIGLSACLKASSVLEMKAGEAERLGLAIGMRKL